MRQVGHVGHMRKMRNVYKNLESEGKKPFGRHWHQWKDSIETSLGNRD
jgi:hypothetical protein